MNDDVRDVQDQAMDRRLDAALGEVLGGESAPDVTARVLARAAAGERIAAADLAAERPDGGLLRPLPRPATAAVRRRWFAAAVLFGVAVVGGVAWLQRRGAEQLADDPAAGPAPLQEPVATEHHRQIRSVAEIAKLPRTVTHVEFRNLGDRAALALRECPWVEHVEFIRDDEDPRVRRDRTPEPGHSRGDAGRLVMSRDQDGNGGGHFRRSSRPPPLGQPHGDLQRKDQQRECGKTRD